MKASIPLLAVAGFVGCGGGSSCFGRHVPAPAPSSTTQPSPSPPPGYNWRDFAFPQKSCRVVLKLTVNEADGGPTPAPSQVLEYRVDGTRALEHVSVTRTPPRRQGNIAQQDFVVREGHIEPKTADQEVPLPVLSDARQPPPRQVRNLDLVSSVDRIVATDEHVAVPHAGYGPCLTTLERMDDQHVWRTYQTWCQGLGLSRIDFAQGKKRRVYDIASTTCLGPVRK